MLSLSRASCPSNAATNPFAVIVECAAMRSARTGFTGPLPAIQMTAASKQRQSPPTKLRTIPRRRIFILTPNAEAERQAVVLQRHSSGYDEAGMLRAVRSSDWFAKANLCNEELMNSKELTYGGEITPPMSHGEGLISSVACPARQITPLSPRVPSSILSDAGLPGRRIWRLLQAHRTRHSSPYSYCER